MQKEQDRIEVRIGLPIKDLISAINELDDEEREFLIENLLAATNPDYLKSIEEAREDYRQGRVLSHEEVFAKARKG
jgi:predicted transposase YdaD